MQDEGYYYVDKPAGGEAADPAAGFFTPVVSGDGSLAWLPLLLVLLLLGALIGWMLALAAARSRADAKVEDIYKAVSDKAKAAAEGAEDQAAGAVNALCAVLRDKLWPASFKPVTDLLAGAHDVLNGKPKSAGPAAPTSGKTISGSVTINDSPPATSAPAGGKTVNQQMHELAKAFWTYWKDAKPRKDELRALQRRLGV
ncbi:MAG TPA: hypothetical protein VD929_00660 [Caulobacteraceae bacterium]|nr:hypothetical protein [Caulobacteraceae bacterium]